MIHTTKSRQKMRRMLDDARRQKLARQATAIWDDLPVATKGEMLLAKWEDEENDFDPATDRADESDYCPRCGYICCECD